MFLMKTREVLARNLKHLMDTAEGRAQSQLGLKEISGVAQSTIGRILRAETEATTDTIEALARVFSMESWQLLTPNLDPKSPPVLRLMTREEEKLYTAFSQAYKKLEKSNS